MQVVDVLILVNKDFLETLGEAFGKRCLFGVAALVVFHKKLQRKMAYVGEVIAVCPFFLLTQDFAVSLNRFNELFGNRAKIIHVVFILTLRRTEKRRKLLQLIGKNIFLCLDRFGLDRGILVWQAAETADRS